MKLVVEAVNLARPVSIPRLMPPSRVRHAQLDRAALSRAAILTLVLTVSLDTSLLKGVPVTSVP